MSNVGPHLDQQDCHLHAAQLKVGPFVCFADYAVWPAKLSHLNAPSRADHTAYWV